MNANDFNKFFSAAEAEMMIVYPKWNRNTLSWLKQHAIIMRRLVREAGK